MMCTISGSKFKRMINGVKRFIRPYSNNLMGYIYLEIDKENSEIKATAIDGHRISVEYANCYDIDESFKCYIKPNIPKIKKNEYVELELVDNKLFCTVGDNIMGYKQPEGTFYKTDELLDKVLEKKPVSVIGVDAVLLKQALESISGNYYKPYVKMEIRGKEDPIIIRQVRENKDCIKAVLPVKLSDE